MFYILLPDIFEFFHIQLMFYLLTSKNWVLFIWCLPKLLYWWSGVWISLFGKQSPLMEVHYFLLWPQLNFLTKSYSTNTRISMLEIKKFISSPCLKSSCFLTNKYMIPFVFNVLPAFSLNQLLCVIEINDTGLEVRETGHLGLF